MSELRLVESLGWVESLGFGCGDLGGAGGDLRALAKGL